MEPLSLERLRRLAEAASEGQAHDFGDREPARWEPYFSVHGDPFVVEEGRGPFAVVATVATGPEDYGRARAEYLAAVDPATVLELLAELEQAREKDARSARHPR